MRRLLKTFGLLTTFLVLIIALPILFTELACRGTPLAQTDATYITDPEDQRPEARTYLTYPEWHIVYAYEGYAEVLKTGAPHGFPYAQSVIGFWSSLCALTQKSDTLGKAGFDAKSTIYTIGASFTLEMSAKAIYEETIGRITSWTGASPQDKIEADMAADYAEFLQQVPWYKYDFDGWRAKLWNAPTPNFRAHERRIALGLEWSSKAAYARLIAKAVAGVGADELTMKIAVDNVDPATFPSVKLIETKGDAIILEVPRYRVFTRLAEAISDQSGTILEIAGNDDILVSVVSERPADINGTIYTATRPGFGDHRTLIAVKVNQLTKVLTTLRKSGIKPEHVYDY